MEIVRRRLLRPATFSLIGHRAHQCHFLRHLQILLISSWSSSSSISLSSSTVNPTDFSMGPGSGSITANYITAPDIMSNSIYSSSGGSPSSGTVPSPTQNIQPLSNCSALSRYSTSNDQYADWTEYSNTAICQGMVTYSGTEFNEMTINYTSYVYNTGSLGQNSWYSGNVSISVSLLQYAYDPTNTSWNASGICSVE